METAATVGNVGCIYWLLHYGGVRTPLKVAFQAISYVDSTRRPAGGPHLTVRIRVSADSLLQDNGQHRIIQCVGF